MTTDESALAVVVRALADGGIPYMVTGSVASSHHGRPRMTNDVDVVIDPSAPALERLLDALDANGFYVSRDVARRALRERRMFNAILIADASKIDLIVRKDRQFSRREMERRAPVTLAGGTAVVIASPEDTILAKLEWAREAAGSEKQLADVAGIVELHGSRLDRGYIDQWARELGVLDLWARIAG